MDITELQTPVPVVEADRLERNLDRMAAYAARHALALRPHTKTHKTSLIAREQVRRGAVGVTCATLREAEVMSYAARDVLIAYPVLGEAKLRRLVGLPEDVHVTVALDSDVALEALATAARANGREVGVLIEIDLGMKRVGVASPAAAVALARLACDRAPLAYRGIAFYPGHVRQPVAEQGEALSELASALDEYIGALAHAGLRPEVVSGGSTPTAWRTHEIAGLTEFRPGTYVYNDRATAALGASAWEDCALTVLATVVSTAVGGQAVIDAGTKALGREPLRGGAGEGFGALLDRPEVVVHAMSEEHGLLNLSRTSWRPRIGELVRVVPNHVCIVVHLNDVVYRTRGSEVVDALAVEARGR